MTEQNNKQESREEKDKSLGVVRSILLKCLEENGFVTGVNYYIRKKDSKPLIEVGSFEYLSPGKVEIRVYYASMCNSYDVMIYDPQYEEGKEDFINSVKDADELAGILRKYGIPFIEISPTKKELALKLKEEIEWRRGLVDLLEK